MTTFDRPFPQTLYVERPKVGDTLSRTFPLTLRLSMVYSLTVIPIGEPRPYDSNLRGQSWCTNLIPRTSCQDVSFPSPDMGPFIPSPSHLFFTDANYELSTRGPIPFPLRTSGSQASGESP